MSCPDLRNCPIYIGPTTWPSLPGRNGLTMTGARRGAIAVPGSPTSTGSASAATSIPGRNTGISVDGLLQNPVINRVWNGRSDAVNWAEDMQNGYADALNQHRATWTPEQIARLSNAPAQPRFSPVEYDRNCMPERFQILLEAVNRTRLNPVNVADQYPTINFGEVADQFNMIYSPFNARYGPAGTAGFNRDNTTMANFNRDMYNLTGFRTLPAYNGIQLSPINNIKA
jgi:hypothetical protein